MRPMWTALEEFPHALAARDFDRLERCFHRDVRVRVLTSQTTRDAASQAAARALFAEWFSDASVLRLVDAEIDSVHGRSRLCYRMSGVEDGRAFVVEQTAYCTVVDGAVEVMDVVCSGFRFDVASAEATTLNVSPR
jgi:hypothetical protein